MKSIDILISKELITSPVELISQSFLRNFLNDLDCKNYFFSEKGAVVQNYGMDIFLKSDEKYTGPDGKEYPKLTDWVKDTANSKSNGDLSTFLHNYLGCLLPIGYQKEIGFEYQYTLQNGFDALKLLKESTVNIPTYAGTGITGTNQNYYRLIPPVFSLTELQ